MKDPTNWKEYEQEIAAYFRSEYPTAEITPNAKLIGRFSKIERQIDLLLEEQASDFAFRIAVDAKHYTDRIDVKDVELFLGLLHDVNVDVGVMICPEGYSQAAINRAHFDDSRLELDILNFKELKRFQGFGAIPYAGDVGVLMPAPFGWVRSSRGLPESSGCKRKKMRSTKKAGVAGAWLFLAASLAWGQSSTGLIPTGTPQSALIHSSAPLPAATAEASNQGSQDILSYISHGWESLTRSLTNCETFEDVKSTAPLVLYLPDGFSTPSTLKDLEKNCRVKIEHLPRIIRRPTDIDVNAINPQGLLYLEHPYVVPGGRFNEMYGWDSYFIVRGLLRDGRLDLARGMVENFFFEVEHYGMVLNANRTYYLTRSQPPFLTSMILAVYDSEKAAGRGDLAWLAKAYKVATKDYEFWMRDPHLAGATGLSRYYDFGSGPAPEVLAGAEHYYRYVSSYFLRHPEEADGHLVRLTRTPLLRKPRGRNLKRPSANPGRGRSQRKTALRSNELR